MTFIHDAPRLCLSIVSHAQGSLVRNLLDDLIRLAPSNIELVLTLNLPEDENLYPDCQFPVRIVRNESPKGFGANHNTAFEYSKAKFFVIVNPDIRLPSLDIEQLLEPMHDSTVGSAAPIVLNSTGGIEDSARRFPTVTALMRRAILKKRISGYQWDAAPIDVDWTAGMFVVFRREAFADVNGFDHRRFFMYFEDVDICRRLKKAGWRVVLQPAVSVIHDARRASHRSFKHLRWHLTSAVRYFTGY